MTSDSRDDEADEIVPPVAPDDDDVPPPRFVKIEDFAADLASLGDTRSPHASLNGSSLATPDAVARALVSGDDEDGVFVGEAIADLAYVIGELGGRQGETRVRELALANSFSIAFKTAAPATEPEIQTPASNELNGAAQLMRALSSRSAHDLLRTLGSKGQAVTPRLEDFLKLLFEHRATLDLQTPRERPIRVTYERAAALYNALRRPIDMANETFIRLGHLTGAYFDTREFRIRLSEPWHRTKVIEGRFVEEIAETVRDLLDEDVLATVAVRQSRKGAHEITRTYTLKDVHQPQQLAAE